MSRGLIVHRAGPGTSVQDRGRTGYLDEGLSASGAADLMALHEGAALLGQPPEFAALELAGMGGIFEVTEDMRIALTGAPMQASIEGDRIAWNASHLLHRGMRLSLGGAAGGNYSYLHPGGGIATDPFLRSRSAHLVARVGAPVAEGETLPVGPDAGGSTGLTLDIADRFAGGTARIIASVQTGQFDAETLARLEATAFARDPRGNRMGARMSFDGAPFAAEGQLNILSEMVVPGDIQVTGDGTPFVLLGECQTTGGYPRIGTVIPPDIPLIAQARAGEPIRFRFIPRAEALATHRAWQAHLAALPGAARPLIRNPHDIPDLLSYQLIDGVISGEEEEKA
ncbi:MAG: biotin-dependent carboxyltransferase family protein [Rhodobacteraceae bacterium]|nr:biotin-dependent carboxyltransferase family protein [Paracoccaceae bacterium]